MSDNVQMLIIYDVKLLYISVRKLFAISPALLRETERITLITFYI